MTSFQLCVIGDDLVNGRGDLTRLGFAGRLCAIEANRGHALDVYALGVDCDTSPDIARRWHPEALARLETSGGALLFCFGRNDMAEIEGDGIRVCLPDSLTAAESILRRASVWKPTLWLGPPPVTNGTPVSCGRDGRPERHRNGRLAALNDAFRELALDMGVRYLDLYSLLGSNAAWQRALQRGDGLHPDEEGHACMAAMVAAWAPWREWMGDVPPRPAPAFEGARIP